MMFRGNPCFKLKILRRLLVLFLFLYKT